MSSSALTKMHKLDDSFVRQSFIGRSSDRLFGKSQQSTMSALSVPETNIVHTAHKWREATHEDLPEIEDLVDNEAHQFFGDVDVATLIAQSPHAAVIVNMDNKVEGFLCLNNYPNIKPLLPEVWTDWMRHHYKLTELLNQNTLFVHFIVYRHVLRPEYLQIYMQDLFLNNMKLDYVCLVSPPNEAGLSFVRKNFIRILFSRAMPVGTYLPTRVQNLHICFRSSLVAKMKIRRALAEDNDDLVDILDASAPKLRNIYGDYYIAEIVSKNEKNRSIIVAEINNQTVGMMCLNTNVDLDKLNHNFELLPFHALRKHIFSVGFNLIQVREIVTRESELFFLGLQPGGEDDYSHGSLSTFPSMQFSTRTSTQSFEKSQIEDDDGSEKDLLEQIEAQLSQTTQIAKEFDFQLMKEWEDILKRFEDREEYYTEHVRNIRLPLSEANVMAIELFGMQSHLDERMSIDLLKAAFDTYRNRDYILLTIPTTSYLPKFLTYFTKAIPRQECNFPDNVYLIHKNNLGGNFSVLFIKENQWVEIQNFINFKGVEEILPAEQIMEMCSDFITNPKSEYSVIICQSEVKIVGLIILRPASMIETIRQNYCLDSYENFDVASSPANFGQIIYCYMSPLFVSHSTYIFKEIFRLTSYTSLYYSIKIETQYADFYNTLLPTMFPLKPRRLMTLPEITVFDDIEPNPKAYEELDTSAFYYTNVRLCAFQRKQIDSRIVVIGFGQTSKTFLEALIYRHEAQHLRFSNITCICPAGILEADMTYSGQSAKLFSPHKLFHSYYLKQLELKVWINFVTGYMTKIDRKNKFVILDKKECVPYDKLYLFCGVQFDVPVEVYSEKTPSNLVLVNKLLHGKMIHYRIKNFAKISGYNLVVYGTVPKAYAGVNFLLNNGVPGENIYFIIPPIERFDELNIQVFDDDFVEAVVYRELDKAGVNVYQNYKFVTWNVNEETNMIKNITFESRFECITIPCALFISYYRKVVNRLTVKALNRSGLVFDGRIVVDAHCRTNDPNIYAAGPLTKYRRILYADRFRHIYYNSKEIGVKLALKLVDNYSRCEADEGLPEPPFKWIVPHYILPLVESTILPGNFHYIHIHQPGFQLPNYVAKTLDNYGTDLITGGPTKPREPPNFLDHKMTEKWNRIEERLNIERDYFRIYLDKHGFVKNIVCLAKKPFNGQNMIHLYGLHEKLLNNLKCKYDRGEIVDFYEFFNGRWAYLLYHDRFYKLSELNEHIFRYNLDGNTEWLSEYLERETKNYKRELPESKRQGLIRYYQSGAFREEIHANLMSFISEYSDSLFMYATNERLSKDYGIEEEH